MSTDSKTNLTDRLVKTIDRLAYMASLSAFDDEKLTETAQKGVEVLKDLIDHKEDTQGRISSKLYDQITRAIEEMEAIDPAYYKKIVQREEAGLLQPLKD